MTSEEIRKQKKRRPEHKTGIKSTLQGILERLREGMEELAGGMNPAQQPVPIPVPTRRRRR